MRKICFLFMVAFVSIFLFGCTKEGKNFKQEYESLNGKKNSLGEEYRNVNIPDYNPIIYSDAKNVIKKIENGDTFYVLFGSKMDQWSRSVVEKAIDVMNSNGIKEVYYVEVLDDEGNEILRDKYVLDEDNFPTSIVKSTKEYEKLLEYFDTLLTNYNFSSINNSGEELNVEEKRIYIPSFIYIEGGVPLKITSGISEKQKDYKDELTEEMLMDEVKSFNDFFVVQ